MKLRSAKRFHTRVRSLVKRRTEIALSSSSARWISRHRLRGKRLILAYHGIIPDGGQPAGDRSLHLREADFVAQLDVLVELADVVPLTEIDEPANGRPRVAITFDDAYQGAVSVGLRALASRGLPATVFVAPARLDRHVFWWDALAHWSGSVEGSIRSSALSRFAGSDERVRKWVAAAGVPTCSTLPEYARAATYAELLAAVSIPGMTIGSHSWSHANLTALDANEVAGELERSRDWLQSNFGQKAVAWLAYPYGLHSDATLRALVDAGYNGGLQITGGWYRPRHGSRFRRPRLNVPAGLSVAGFRARVLGSIPS